MLLPRITTFADPQVITGRSGAVHDAGWLVETALVETPVTVLLDASSRPRLPPREHRELDGRRRQPMWYRPGGVADDRLARLLAGRAVIVLHPDAQIPAWVEPLSYERAVRLERGATGALARLARSLAGEAVVLVGGEDSVFSPAEVAALGAARPDLRLFDACAPESLARRDSLIASDGGRLVFDRAHEGAFCALALAFDPGRDAELVIHADRATREPRPSYVRSPLVERDRVRVDAVTPHVDEPVFTVTAKVRQPYVGWAIVAYHQARRARAVPPTAAQLEGVALRPLVLRPDVEPLAARPYHPTAVTGAIVLDVGGRLERLPLAPVRIATATAALELELVDADAVVTARSGTVVFRGARLRPRRVRRLLEPSPVTGGVILAHGVMVGLAAGDAIELGEVRITVEVEAVTPAPPPVDGDDGEVRHVPGVLRVAGEPLELVMTGRHGELRRAGQAMTIVSIVDGIPLGPTELWWVESFAQTHRGEVRADSALLVSSVAEVQTATGTRRVRLEGIVEFNLRTNRVRLRATQTIEARASG